LSCIFLSSSSSVRRRAAATSELMRALAIFCSALRRPPLASSTRSRNFASRLACFFCCFCVSCNAEVVISPVNGCDCVIFFSLENLHESELICVTQFHHSVQHPPLLQCQVQPK